MRVTSINVDSDPMKRGVTVRLDISCTVEEAAALLETYRRQFRHEVTVDFKEPKVLPVSTANLEEIVSAQANATELVRQGVLVGALFLPDGFVATMIGDAPVRTP